MGTEVTSEGVTPAEVANHGEVAKATLPAEADAITNESDPNDFRRRVATTVDSGATTVATSTMVATKKKSNLSTAAAIQEDGWSATMPMLVSGALTQFESAAVEVCPHEMMMPSLESVQEQPKARASRF